VYIPLLLNNFIDNLNSKFMYNHKLVTLHAVFSCFLPMFLLLQNPVTAQPATITSGIDSIIQRTTPRAFNGVVSVSQNGQTLYQKAYGLANREQQTALTLKDQFVIGSLSKQITGALILLEVETGRVQLNNKIKQYLPRLTAKWTDSVTVEQLLNHTSGIVKLDQPLQNRPGRVFAYSNINYDLLGQILENVTGKSYAVLATQLFDKCSMRNTVVPGGSKKIPYLVKGYMQEPDSSLTPTGDDLLQLLHSPSGGIVSTVADLQRWNNCLHNGKVLKGATYKTMITPTSERTSRWGNLGYACGVQVDNLEGIQEISHSGYVPGYIAVNIYYPQKHLSIIVLENTGWLADDMDYTFYMEDQIRKLLRAQIAADEL
jgi:D-alanyl-D-alanine carboxypeptidase